MKTTSRSITARNIRRRSFAKKIGKFETLEQRQVMANDFLAGTAFIDANNNGQLDTNENYLQGATIELRSADGSTLINSQVTDAKGAYVFAISPGDYKLVNRSAANYAGSATESLAGLSTVNGSTANSINVTLRSPTDLGASVDMDRFVNVFNIYEEVTVSIGGYSTTTKIGQLPAKAHGSTLTPNPSPEFWTLSVDLYNRLGNGLNGPYTVDASVNPLGTGSPQNGERVAYLYNHYGLTALNAVEAAALQLAVWELLYDASSTDPDGDLSSGNFKVLSATPDTILTAESYLTASLNKSERAVFLNVPGQPATPTINSSQGIIVGGSFNFANVPAAKIGDLVWHDKNKNGRQESIEPRIAGATVKLYQDTTLIATTTTDTNGFYQFDHLLAGTYKVEFVLPDGFTQVSPANATSDDLDSDGPITGPITLAAGATNNTVDQGFYKLARLGDFVWNDRNGNGRQTPDEEGIANAQVKLLQDDVLVETKVTDNNGFYLFENLQPGVYNLEFIKPVGYAYISPQGFESSPLDSDGPFVFDVPLESGQDEFRIDQGFYGASTIGNFVWHDLDADGIQDSTEVGIDGVTVELLRDGNVIATTVTTGGGLYSFVADPGTYQVKFTTPTGYTNVSPTDATTDDLDSDGLITAPVTVGTDETITNVDIGFFNLATIGDFVWHDLDADGIQDGDEPGIDGLTVSLMNGTTELATTVTAGGGKYAFSVVPGSYAIKFTRLSTYDEVSPTNATSDDLDSDGVVADGLTTPSVTVISGATNNTLDQGFYKLVKIGNFVWDDLDADGVQDENEPGIDGVTVELLQGDTVVATTTTVGGGLYSFGVAPGTYTLNFTKPTGYAKSSPTDATSDDLDSDDLTAPLTVISGATNTTFDKGYYNEATIGNYVWHDLNANGIQESNEPGVNGVSVSLMRGTTEVANTLTAGGGFYSFSVEPGTYTVKFTKPSGYSDISPTDAADDNIDSDGLTVPVTVVSGETNNSIDLGLFNVATIGNFVWNDVDADGIQDSTDVGINGVAVSLMRGSTEVASTTTTGGGLYSFIVAPGVYTIKFTLPLGYTEVSPANATSDDVDSDGPNIEVNVLSGDINNTFDQGFYSLATIGNYVWHDLNADGVQDSHESGIDGVAVSLMRGMTEIATSSTAGGGIYSFSVIPGEYTVKFIQPTTYSNVSPTDATSDDLDSDGLSASVTVLSGETNNSIDLGLFNLVSIGNYVWEDKDADGTQDSNESGIDGVAVSLMRGMTEVATTSTAGGGLYSFSVVPGTYSVQFTKPTSYSNISPSDTASDDLDSDGLAPASITLLSGATNNTLDLGLFNLATIGNYVWDDKDADGTQDGNESGIDGVAVSLMQGMTEVATTSTTGGGFYSFNVVPGTYSVKFTKPTNFSNVSPTDAASDDLDSDGLTPGAITLSSGETNNTLDLGLFNLATIGNYVWDDADADGIQDSTEVGINGVSVSLMQGSTQVATTTTTGGGLYSFIVAPGSYTVEFTQPTDYNSVSPANATSDDLDSDGLLASVTVISGEVNNSIDQGFYNSVSDVCIAIDMQGNTPYSGTHGNIRTFSTGGVSVNASAFSRTTSGSWSPAYLGSYGGGLGVTDSSETGESTTHTIDNTGRLNYVLFEFSQQVLVDAAFLGYVVKDSDLTVWIGNVNNAFTSHQTLSDSFLNGLGFTETNLTTLTSARTADINAGGIRGNILVIAAQVDDTTPEDYFKIANLTVCVPGGPANASIGDYVWHDINGNGLQESHEPGIHGATVTLVGGGPDNLINGVGDTTITTSTDSTGQYKFANLTVGTQYRVTFSTPSGYDAATPRKVGANSTLDSDGLTSDVIVLASGEFNSSIDAGFVKYVKVGNYVWNDTDKDGLQETGETGIGGVQVTIAGMTGSGVSVTQSTTTASDGSYQFAALQPGTYTVFVAASNFTTGGVLVGYTTSPTAVGTDRGLDSNFQPSPTTPATLSSGGDDLSLDFGYYTTTTLACVTMKMEGNTSTSGTAGNIRIFSAGGISVKASAFARDTAGAWSNAYLGSYPGGLGVTDGSEGSGGNNTHMTDNVGRRNYILFEFSQDVTIDTAFLGYVVSDSDLTAWIGSVPDSYNNHRTLTDSYLTALGYNEHNDTTLTTSRTANLNANNRSGNILVVSAATTGTQNDWFKLAELTLCAMVPTNTAGTKFFVVDDSADKTFKYTSAVQYQNNFAIVPTSPTGIAANPAGTNTWVSDVNGKVYKYDNNGVLHSSWSTGKASTQGVTTNGTSIWTVSSSTDRVYFYSGAASFVPSPSKLNPTLTSYFRLHTSNTNPKDLATDGNTVWVIDDGSYNFVYAYSMSGTYLGRWQLDSANTTPTGITIDPTGGSKIWIVDSGTDKIYEYSGATGCRSGGLVAMKTYALNTSGGNSNPQGIADPPSGDGEENVSEAMAASLLVDGSSVNPDVNPYYNVLIPSDVNDDGLTTAMDALVIINRLNSGTAGELSIDAVASGQRLDLADVNNDGFVSPLDALLVINQLNQGAPPAIEQAHDDPAIDLPLGATSATDEVFGDIGLAAEGEMSAAAFMFEAEMNPQRRRR